MIDFTEISDGETWELFARDFLSEIGFFIESSPDRGADAGKDLLASEDLGGRLGNYRMRWLVSCKHYASSGKAVSETEEQNLLERVESFTADGFIGFYSTVPTAAWNTRLRTLRDTGKIRDFRIFDHKLIENYLLRVGYSTLLIRYFPESYKVVKPLQAIIAEYQPLACKVCGKDLLEKLYRGEDGILGLVRRIKDEEEDERTEKMYIRRIEAVYWACKGACDQTMEDRYASRGMISGWEDITDLAIPAFYLKFFFSLMNNIRDGRSVFTDEAYEQMKTFLFAMAQKVLRETTGKEGERVERLLEISSMMEG